MKYDLILNWPLDLGYWHLLPVIISRKVFSTFGSNGTITFSMTVGPRWD